MRPARRHARHTNPLLATLDTAVAAIVIVPAVLYLVAGLAFGQRGGLLVAALGFAASWLTGLFIARNEPPSVVRTVVDTVNRYTRPLTFACLILYVPCVGRRGWPQVKRITARAKQRLSYQRHGRRSEHWFIVAGTGVVILNGDEHLVGPGEAIDVPCGTAHRIYNSGVEDLVFVEVQHGDYFGEDDIVRLDDDYGRTS